VQEKTGRGDRSVEQGGGVMDEELKNAIIDEVENIEYGLAQLKEMPEKEKIPPIMPEKCPCCGGIAGAQLSGSVWIECRKCGLQTKGYNLVEKAIEAWNRRV